MAFAVATCPNSPGRFRLVWRIGNKKLPPSTVIRLTCPTCAHSFEQTAVELLYEMLSGKRAFRRGTPAETMTAVLKEDPPELSDPGHPVSPALDRIVRRCLEKNPD